MRSLIYFILFPQLLFSTFIFAQNDWESIYKKSTNIYSDFMFSNYEDEINSLYNMDVYSHFSLNEEYNTPLKKKYFEKTTEYKELLDSLDLMKKSMLENWYNVETDVSFSHSYDLHTNEYVFNGLDEYNSAVIERGYLAIDGVYFPELYNYYTTKKIGMFDVVRFSFPCSEELALVLEDIKEIKLVFLFKVDGVKKIHFENAFGIVDYELPIAKDTVLLIMDDYDKIYASVEF